MKNPGPTLPIPPRSIPLCDRRRFLSLASAGLCGAAIASSARASTGRLIDIGTLKDYPKDVISEKFIQHNFFVVRHQGRLFAFTAICPHKGNGLLDSPQKPGTIICSGHDATFSPEGLPQRGPTKRALARYAITLDSQGRILVDPSREFPRAQWDDKAAYLPMPS